MNAARKHQRPPRLPCHRERAKLHQGRGQARRFSVGLSHTIRGLEEGLGLRLLTRTTRSVSPTEAGERLLRTVGPRFDEIKTELAALSELRDKPAGAIRITAGEHAAEAILWPAVARLLPNYPDIKIEIIVDYGLTDIVAEPATLVSVSANRSRRT
jgi:DNA-binding transcriptional LysR family regulator